MGKKNKIVILSGMIKTGKSTALLDWTKHRKVSGFLTPTIEGRKEFYDIENETYYPYELRKKNRESIVVGDFILNACAFKLAQLIVKESFTREFKWIVIDEIGKLELENSGHHSLFKRLLNHSNSNILVVIRATLLHDVILKYNLFNAAIIDIDQLEKLS